MQRAERLPIAAGVGHRRDLVGLLVPAAIMLLVAFLVFMPLGMVIYGSLRDAPPGAPGSFTLQNYVRILEPRYLSSFFNTMRLGVSVAIGCVVLGAALAWLVHRTDLPLRTPLAILITSSFYFPSFINAEAWTLLAAPRSGMLNVLIRQAVPGFTGFNVYTLEGMIFVMILSYVPYVFLFLAGPFRSMDPALEEASLAAGAGVWRTLRHVTLPLVGYGLAAGALIAFVQAAGLFGVPAILGIQQRVWVLSTQIYSFMTFNPPDYGAGAALSLVLLLVAAAGVLLQNKVLAKSVFTTITGRGYRPRRFQLGPWRWVGFALCVAYVLFAVVLPILALAYVSFQPFYDGTLDFSRVSTKNYTDTFADPLTARAFRNSLILSVGGATIGVLLGALVSYIVIKSRAPGRRALDVLSILPAAFPGLVIAVGLLWAYITTPLYGTVWILVVSYVTHYLPQGVRTVSSNLVQLDDSLEESARVSGASWLAGLRDVVFPLIRPGLFSAWLLLFVVFFRELSSAVVLYTIGNEVLAVAIWHLHQNGNLGKVSALSMITLVAIYAVFALAHRLLPNGGARE